MKKSFLFVILSCIISIMVNNVDSRGTMKKELPSGVISNAEDLKPAGTTFILNKAIESGSGTESTSSSGSSSGVRRFRGAGFGNIASRFNYPTKYNVGGSLGDEIELDDFDGINHENFEVHNHGISYPLGVRTSVMGGLPQGNLGYGISKTGLGLTSSHGDNGVEISHLTDTDKSSKSNHEAAEEDAKGYKVAEDFDKAEKGQVEKVHHQGHYDSTSGSKKGDLDEVQKFSEKETAAKGEKGESFEKSEGHKKGHKTSGYHNVYHKDEYKKDTSFYDDEHSSAHETAFGTESSRHDEVQGQHEKVEKLDKQFHEEEQEKKGSFTNGHQYGVAQGHDREHSEKEHYEKTKENQKTEKEVSESY